MSLKFPFFLFSKDLPRREFSAYLEDPVLASYVDMISPAVVCHSGIVSLPDTVSSPLASSLSRPQIFSKPYFIAFRLEVSIDVD